MTDLLTYSNENGRYEAVSPLPDWPGTLIFPLMTKSLFVKFNAWLAERSSEPVNEENIQERMGYVISLNGESSGNKYFVYDTWGTAVRFGDFSQIENIQDGWLEETAEPPYPLMAWACLCTEEWTNRSTSFRLPSDEGVAVSGQG